ncbi:MAG TPA: hypothetical protein VIM75_21100 [Ohtaekwangia sp.]|uniref:WD40/YVTN/BNR-like repeat-containing protein n=1 Tax=Ohtaekwangia sp. TaxID=2066019 RepID=UPI002F93132F
MKLYILMFASLLLTVAKNEPTEGLIYLSRDGGQQWTTMDTGLPDDAAINAWVVFQNSVVVGTESHGIYISDNAFKSWKRSSTGLPASVKINALLANKNTLLAGTYQHGIYISYNEGSTWQATTKGIGLTSVRCFFMHHGIIFAGTTDGIFVSNDQGRSWQSVQRGFQVNTFASDNERIFAATNIGIYRSTDSGKTWIASLNKGAFANLAADQDKLVAVMFDGRAYISSDHGMLWLDNAPFLDQYTFKLTPVGRKIPSAPWRDSLFIYYYQQLAGRNGLPNKNFSLLLRTPYGILATASHDGC